METGIKKAIVTILAVILASIIFFVCFIYAGLVFLCSIVCDVIR